MVKKVPCEVFCRIVGYYRPVQNWNAGKAAEYQDRVFFKVENSDVAPVACACEKPIIA